METCRFCEVSFKTVKGLRVHQNHAHPEEYHKERAGKSYSKCVWPEGESTMLVKIELELKIKGTEKLSTQVAECHQVSQKATHI